MDLLDLMVKIGVQDEASGNVGGIASNITGKLATAAKAGGVALSAVTAAAAGATRALVSNVNDVAAYGDNIDKMSQKMGMSAEAYQEWDAVMQHCGTSMETMKASMKTLANAAESGNEAFQKLGLSQEQVASMSQEELFEATIAGLQNVEDTTERTYLAGQLLGRGATELGALLNTSAEDTQAMRDRVHELGGVMSDEAVKAAAAYQDSLQDMQTAFSGLKNTMMAEFLPGMTEVMNGLQGVFSGNYDEGVEQIGEGISAVIDNMAEILPRVTEVGSGIIGALAEAVSENLPDMLSAIIDLVTVIADALIENIPTIVNALVGAIPQFLEAGLQLFLSLLDALTEAAPQIIDGLTQAAVQLIEVLPQYLPQMLEAAGTLFLAIATAIVENLPEIVAALVDALGQLVGYVIKHGPEMLKAGLELIGNLAAAIAEALPDVLGAIGELAMGAVGHVGDFVGDMLKAGADLVQGLIKGIRGAIGRVADVLIGGLKRAVNSALRFLGIASPSKLFDWVGQMSMEGLAGGIEDTAAKAEKAMEKAVQGVYGSASGTIAKMQSGMTFGDIEGPTIRTTYRTAERQPTMTDAERQIITALRELRKAIPTGVYLDSGSLVGQLAPDMSRAIVGV